MTEGKHLVFDAVALCVYAVAANPAVTGVGVHEWLGLGAFAVLFAHLAAHMDWVAEAFRKALSGGPPARTAHLALDALLLVALVACVVSGAFVSGAVLPFFGAYATGYFFWDPLHALSAKVLLALLVVHVAAHGRAILGLFRKRPSRRGRRE